MKPDTAATTIDRLKINPRKEPLPLVASLPPSGSFFNEKMLSEPCLMQVDSGPAFGGAVIPAAKLKNGWVIRTHGLRLAF
jgi:hypothetical protein